MTVARTAVGATTLHGLIYAVGGECALAESQEETMYLRCTEVYDPIMKEWHSCADIRVARSFISLCSLGGYLYALGEMNSNILYSCTFYFTVNISKAENEWQKRYSNIRS